ncbi:MAG TPA: hypothetical protein PKM25_09740 [Candidatus Ozemobacteraceae bacterium]|nr:hypothetical protein [Candidatus Ozemobacteraceae bacterium]
MTITPVSIIVTKIKLTAHAWCRGKQWFPRALFLLFLLNIALNSIADPRSWTLFGPINLGIHETGHLVCHFFGPFIGISAGTVFQLAAPVAIGIGFLAIADLFALSFSGIWLSISLLNVAVYVADARARSLPLVRLGWNSTVIHDWNYLLSALDLLPYDKDLAWLLSWTAYVILACSVAWGVWLCLLMATLPKTPIPGYPAT